MRTNIVIVILLLLLHIAILLAEPTQAQNPTPLPALPVSAPPQSCQLDMSDELFGGVGAACSGRVLDRSRCCPVLAAWLYAAHARSALRVTAAQTQDSLEQQPMVPDDVQNCTNTLQISLSSRGISIQSPNKSCDTFLCFCGIRLHQITSLSCSSAFNITGNRRHATPTAAVRNLAHNCRNSSYAGCTRCLSALQKLNAHEEGDINIMSEDARRMMFMRMDCQLMGLTWLLARNKTAYIPTVSAVLRALMYSPHPSPDSAACSPDQENMPVAVDSVQLDRHGSSAPTAPAGVLPPILLLILSLLPRWAPLGF